MYFDVKKDLFLFTRIMNIKSKPWMRGSQDVRHTHNDDRVAEKQRVGDTRVTLDEFYVNRLPISVVPRPLNLL